MLENTFQNGFWRVSVVVCGGTVDRPSETPWNTFQGNLGEHGMKGRERSGTP